MYSKNMGKTRLMVTAAYRFICRHWMYILLSVLYFWLFRQQRVWVVHSPHDDEWFIRMATSIRDGHWLGSYNHMTLIKLPLYPIFLSVFSALGVPVGFAQTLLYWFAASLFYFLVFIQLASPLSGVLFAFLLYNPSRFSDAMLFRVLRSDINAILALFIFASFSILLLTPRIRWCTKRWFAWFYASAFFLSLFYINREENITFLSLEMSVLGYLAYKMRYEKRFLRHIFMYVLVSGVALFLVSILNYSWYGIFAPTEFHTVWFRRAYSQISRVKPLTVNNKIPIPKEVRKELYHASPAFRQLEQFLEGDIGYGWAEVTFDFTHLDPNLREIGGDYFRWALREAVAAAGYYESPDSARLYYQRLAHEIDFACSEKLVDCRLTGNVFLPHSLIFHIADIIQDLSATFWFTITFRDIHMLSERRANDQDLIKIFESVTGMPSYDLDASSNEIVMNIMSMYSRVGLVMYIALVCAVFLILGFYPFSIVRKTFPWALLLIIIVGVLPMATFFAAFTSVNSENYAIAPTYLPVFYVSYLVLFTLGITAMYRIVHDSM